MHNTFYNSFDIERFPATKISEAEYRTAFQIERDRITFSYPFRRLQSKTQVFQSGEYDFYRTRLTHSIEVAKICRSICEYLKICSPHLNESFYIDPDLTEAIGLAHDIGHPPFGHIGERKLNEMMAPYGGFEGNAQTLRILTELVYENSKTSKGIAPTRAFLDGILKYKALHKDCSTVNLLGEIDYPANHFIYDAQEYWRSKVFGGRLRPSARASAKDLNNFKSIECQIMDWADDTAYSLNDIVDGIHARYISVASLTDWASEQSLNTEQTTHIEKLCDVIRKEKYEPFFAWRIGEFVRAVHLKPRAGFLSRRTNRHAFNLHIANEIKAESQLYKRVASDLIFKSTQLQQIEFKGGYILEKLFKALTRHCAGSDNPSLRLLPPAVQDLIAKEETKAGKYRRICDYTAGLTDGLAIRTYKRLFDPDFGSIAELV